MSAWSRVIGPHARLTPIVAGHALALGCGLAGVKVMTLLVPPEAYGRFSVFMSFAPIGMWVIHAGLVKYILRHWAGASDQRTMLGTTATLFARKLPWLALATAGATALLTPDRWLTQFLLLFGTASLLSWAAMGQAALQAGKKNWRDFAVTTVGAVTRSFLPPLLYYSSQGAEAALPLGYLAHALALAAAASWAARIPPDTARAAGGRAMPDSVYQGPLFAVLAVNGWVMAGLQRWVTAALLGATTAGFVALATNIATLVPAMLGTIALQYFQPGIYAAPSATMADRRELARRIDRIALAHALLSVAGLGVLRFILPWLVGPLIGESYRPALAMMLPTGAAMLALATGWFYHALLLAGHRERACGPTELSAAVVLVLGSTGAAWAGQEWWSRWCLLSPLIPWVVNRPIARRHFFRPGQGAGPAPGR